MTQHQRIRGLIAAGLWLIVMALAIIAVAVARLDAAPMAGGACKSLSRLEIDRWGTRVQNSAKLVNARGTR
jgi:hypothetical protein